MRKETGKIYLDEEARKKAIEAAKQEQEAIKTQYPDFSFSGANNKVLVKYTGKSEQAVIPDFVTEIGGSCFKGSKIKSVILSENTETIGYSAFENCVLLENVELQIGLRRIQIKAFSGCKRLTILRIPQSIMFIETGAFDKCPRLLVSFFSKE